MKKKSRYDETHGLFPKKCYAGDEIKKDAMGRVSFKFEEKAKCLQSTRFWWENLRERDNLEGLSVGGRIILNWILCRVGTEEGEILCHSGHGNECISDINCWKIF